MTEREQKEYELAKREGDRRFGSPCEHKVVKNGVCANCLRRMYVSTRGRGTNPLTAREGRKEAE